MPLKHRPGQGSREAPVNLTTHGRANPSWLNSRESTTKPDFRADTFMQAVDWILERLDKSN